MSPCPEPIPECSLYTIHTYLARALPPQVIRISQGVHCRGATLRDVGTFTVAVAGVGLAFASGHVRAVPVLPVPASQNNYSCDSFACARAHPMPCMCWL